MTMNNNALNRNTTTARNLGRQVPQNQNVNQELTANFQVNGMEVKLTPNIVRNYLVSGNKEAVSFEELAMFINLCKFQHLNPWLKEAYCIKYGSEPATIVVGKDAFMKRAENNPEFDGLEAGVIVVNKDTGDVNYRKGTIKLPDEELVGGWSEVYRKDKKHPFHIEVSFDEYCGRKKDGTPNSQWRSKPGTMIRKVAMVQALREAFPTSLGGMYVAEEQGLDEPISNASVVSQNKQNQKQIEMNGQSSIPSQKDQNPATEQAPVMDYSQDNEEINNEEEWDTGFSY